VNNSLERDEGFLESDHFWGRLKKRRKKEREIRTFFVVVVVRVYDRPRRVRRPNPSVI